MTTVRQNIFKQLCDSYGSRAEFAVAINVTPGYVHQLYKGLRPITEKTALKIAKKLNLPNDFFDKGEKSKEPKIQANAEWLGGFDLWDDKTPLDSDEVALPFFREVSLSAGSGRTEVIENHGAKLRFAKSTLKKQGVQPEHAACVTVSGNSMEPALPDGATIGIDTNSTAIKNGEMYAIDHDGHLRVKLVYKMPGDVIRLRSFNSDEWPDEHYSGYDAAKIKIIGRVFWWSVLR